MANENKWEYDYSNIYNRPAEPNTYTNVGSSGTNTANQASQPSFAAPQQPVQPAVDVPVQNAASVPVGTAPDGFATTAAPVQPAQPVAAPVQATAVPTGAVTGMPPPPPAYNGGQAAPRKQRGKKKKRSFLVRGVARVLSLVIVAAVGFAGGYVGSMYGTSTESAQSASVVVQQVTRDTSDVTSLSTSTDGNDLTLVSAAALSSESVVVITTEQMIATNSWYGTQSVQSGAGSGVIISEDGYILTCAHVISDAANIIVTVGEEDYTASVVGSDAETDIAVIKIEATGLTAATLGDSDALSVGETVIAVGNPLGELGGSVTQGIVSALNRVVVVESYEMTLIQMDASVSPGNSGGGLFNMAGELVGIVNAKSSDSDSEGIGFSIPINTAISLATNLIENGYITGRPELGIVAVSISDADTAAAYGVSALGIYVYSINEGSAAEAAGLQVGDRLISIDDIEISVLTDLTDAIDAKEVGETVNLLVARSGQMLTVTVTLGEQGAPTTTTTTETPEVTETLPEDATTPELDPGMTMPDDSMTMPDDGMSVPDDSTTTTPGSGRSSSGSSTFPFG